MAKHVLGLRTQNIKQLRDEAGFANRILLGPGTTLHLRVEFLLPRLPDPVQVDCKIDPSVPNVVTLAMFDDLSLLFWLKLLPIKPKTAIRGRGEARAT